MSGRLVEDEADLAAGRTITCPVQIIASEFYLVGGTSVGSEDPLSIWRRTFAPEATGTTIRCGHFVAEEAASATLGALRTFLQMPAD